MFPLASVIDFDALWKIVLIALCGGVGVTAVFGVGVIRSEALFQARERGDQGAVLLNGTAVVACGLICLAAVVVGVLAMTHK
jgi:hypothetical protein